ncbi:ATP-binding protein [Nocardia sp. XZ_19_369]|uniref:ATP-binding protein n=1 Tax=Nocardia sp. XZ_19_369 TaxID=2769487 RepID=UPI001E5000F1|nr:ATP-binding protein [Nocardia sp. XZ_19_369]
MSQSLNAPEGERREPLFRRLRIPLLALLTCAAVTSVVVVVAVYYAPTDFRVPLTIGAVAAAIALCATVTAAVHYRGAAIRARQAAAAVTAEASARMAAASEATNLHAWEAKNSDSRRSAAMAAFAGAAGRMQAMTTSMLAELREMEHRHADPKVLADLLHLDHRTAQAGRLADSIAVLSGARSGRRWAKPIAMESILRGAMGRVSGYQRVRLRAIAEIAIAGHAAEGVMHTLAELLDNACNFSPPTTEVHVYAAEVPAGVVLTIEDSGLVMSESALRRAEQTVSNGPDGRGQRASDLSSLSGTRLGLAVVGHLARKHGLTVSFRPSAIGGTAVVVVVPRDLTARVDRSQPSALGTIPAIPTATLPSATSQLTALSQPKPASVARVAALPDFATGNPVGANPAAAAANLTAGANSVGANPATGANPAAAGSSPVGASPATAGNSAGAVSPGVGASAAVAGNSSADANFAAGASLTDAANFVGGTSPAGTGNFAAGGKSEVGASAAGAGNVASVGNPAADVKFATGGNSEVGAGPAGTGNIAAGANSLAGTSAAGAGNVASVGNPSADVKFAAGMSSEVGGSPAGIRNVASVGNPTADLNFASAANSAAAATSTSAPNSSTPTNPTAWTPSATPNSAPDLSPTVEHTSMGLPKRRRGSTLAAVHPAGLSLPTHDAPAAATPPVSTPASFGAFQRAVSGRDTDTSAAATPSPSPTVAVENDR